MWKILLIAGGGAVGTVMRYGLAELAKRLAGDSFPVGTLLANLAGCLVLGVVMESAGERQLAGVSLKLVIGTGMMGGFTTYSSFNLEALRLAEEGQWAKAIAYVALTLTLCIAAGVAGIALSRQLRG